ncbi:hypothetical protein SAMN05421640_1352 [Ekhidna lutea]|uniref:Uncharacterized protein n=1 Tax=Ekhidna lutea TaxID=447679 RepID=A0A239HK84_EKHLU|nr:DUF3857 domain-containing protein [Ekhidna lutea]SNS81541.1 hypothetical protein SAMN05421640_1352 [Ekhidna lutea]
MSRILISFVFAGIFFSSLGQYDLSALEDSLIQNANEVIVFDSTLFSVKDINESKLVRKYKVIILKDPLNQGKDLYLHQDQFKNVEFVNVTVRSLNGSVREKLKLKDFNDVSLKGYSMASDSRLLYRNIIENDLPYEIEVDYEVTYSGSMFYPKWQPQDEDVAVISAAFTVESELPNSFRFKSFNVDPEVVEEGKKVHWQVTNLKPYKTEYYTYDDEYYGPVVYTAPNQFQMDFIEGNMDSWTSFGDWISRLNAGKDDLDSAVLNEIQSLIPGDASEHEKVKIVYDYLQERTRYVSIQLGIGGWQPFSSNFVHTNGYGDCKALSFYTKSLLERVGVDSYYTLINAGKNASDTKKDFPMSKFNHAILTVPMANDTVWLECTSQTNPFGYMGSFTSDRNALLIKEQGSEIIRTKKYAPAESKKVSKYQIKLNPDGIVAIELNRVYTGLMIEENRFDDFSVADDQDQIDWFVDRSDWSSMNLEDIKFEPPTNEIVPEGKLSATFQLNNAVKKAGKRLFVPLRGFLNSDDLIVDRSTKQYPFEIGYGKTYLDSLIFEVPVGYHLESNYRDMNMKGEYGSLDFSVIKDGEKVIMVRKLVINAGLHDPSKYADFQGFVSDVKKTEVRQLVFVNKT